MTAHEIQSDVLTESLLSRYSATFDRPMADRDVTPQGIHWCLCTPQVASDRLKVDGHGEDSSILPHTDLPRRMWASSDVRFLSPILAGSRVERILTLVDSTEKAGSSGKLLFVRLKHVMTAETVPAVEEIQTIVYRPAPVSGAPAPVAPRPAPAPVESDGWDWERRITPSSALLFRYSALTFNSHRIHYDQRYATGVEGYPDLVVHGPLMASLLLDLVDRELGSNRLARFSYRAVAPAFVGGTLRLLGRKTDTGLELRVRSGEGVDHVSATADLHLT